jgi:hypothetical protein
LYIQALKEIDIYYIQCYYCNRVYKVWIQQLGSGAIPMTNAVITRNELSGGYIVGFLSTDHRVSFVSDETRGKHLMVGHIAGPNTEDPEVKIRLHRAAFQVMREAGHQLIVEKGV